MATPRRAALDVDDLAELPACQPRRRADDIAPASSFAKPTRVKASAWRQSLAPLAVMAAFSTIVGLGVATPGVATAEQPIAAVPEAALLDRGFAESRSANRPALSDEIPTAPAVASAPASAPPSATPAPTPTPTTDPATVLAKANGVRYATSAGVNIRAGASTATDVVGTLSFGQQVNITALVTGEWQQIDLNGSVAWVATKFLAATKPTPSSANVAVPADGNYSTAPCKYGSGIESGITPNTRQVFRAFCAVFPQITSYGGYRRAESWSYHTRGAAIDAMVSNRDLGWQMAKWAAANADALNIDQVIYAQRIWTKSNRTWRPMADRGSITANHYDHVHISVG